MAMPWRIFRPQTDSPVFNCAMGRLVHTGLGSLSLVAFVPPYAPPPTRLGKAFE